MQDLPFSMHALDKLADIFVQARRHSPRQYAAASIMRCAPLGEVSVRDVMLRTSSDAAEKVADAATAAAEDGDDALRGHLSKLFLYFVFSVLESSDTPEH
jgi:hypothetical protein